MGDHPTGNQAKQLAIEQDSAPTIELRSGQERQQRGTSPGKEPDPRRAACRKEVPIDAPTRSWAIAPTMTSGTATAMRSTIAIDAATSASQSRSAVWLPIPLTREACRA
jgi:hypothetical protein